MELCFNRPRYLINKHCFGLSGRYSLCSPFAGILGALAYMTFPLDAVHATTLSNDILLSTFLWAGGLLFFISCQRYQYNKHIILSVISGFIVGAAVAIKFNAVIPCSF